MHRIPPEHLEFAKALRMQLTDAEALMWSLLRNRRFGGFKFRRQYAVAPFVLDFYCAEKSLAVELDGGQHANDTMRDERRSKWLQSRNLKVVRFWNHDVLERTDAVLEDLWSRLHSPSLAVRIGAGMRQPLRGLAAYGSKSPLAPNPLPARERE